MSGDQGEKTRGTNPLEQQVWGADSKDAGKRPCVWVTNHKYVGLPTGDFSIMWSLYTFIINVSIRTTFTTMNYIH